MKKNNNQQLVPICFLLAIIIAVIIIVMMCMPKWEEYTTANARVKSTINERINIDQKMEAIKAQNALIDMKMKNLKTIVEADVDSSAENLGMFGNLFEQILSLASSNGLLIRSIEYELNPESDPIYRKASDGYNVCELKLSIVGAYMQLRDFLVALNKVEHLLYISKLNVAAFSGDTDYILVEMSINLYSKKLNPTPKRKNAANQPFPQK